MSDDPLEDNLDEAPSVEDLVTEENAKKAAKPIATFHKQLIDSGMSDETARQVTNLYTRRILFGQYS